MLRDEVNKAFEVLKNGGLILYPTDTIWGIGCDATNEKAVEKIYKIKKEKCEVQYPFITIKDLPISNNLKNILPNNQRLLR